ncbi:MAG: endonuclease domain-containing protein [Patescibacteria group bacterium]|nr:endonuclease domain-containing protein [Patescibacteria group bacterium]
MTKLISNGSHIPYDPDLVLLARILRKNMTKYERKLWYEFLRHREYQFHRQKPIVYYIADFYCPAYRLVIEVDGAQHFTAEGMEADKDRTEILNNYGIEVMRFTNNEIENDFNEVCSKILEYTNNSPLFERGIKGECYSDAD